MSDRLTPLLENAFPSTGASQELAGKLDGIAIRLSKRSRRRRTFGVFGVLGLLGVGLALQVPIRTGQRLLQIRAYEPGVVTKTESYVQGELQSVRWTKDGNMRFHWVTTKDRVLQTGDVTHRFSVEPEQLILNGAHYSYDPDRKVILREKGNDRAGASIVTQTSGVVGGLAMIAGHLLGGGSSTFERTSFQGRAADRITSFSDRLMRMDSYVDPVSNQLLGSEQLARVGNSWQSVRLERLEKVADPPARLFDPSDLGPGPIVDLEDLRHEFVTGMFGKLLGQGRLGNGSTISLRAIEMNSDGLIFVAYTGPKMPNNYTGLGPVSALDDQGNTYFSGTEGFYDPDASKGRDADSLQFAYFVPAFAHPPKWPVQITLVARTNADGSWPTPTFLPGSRFNPYGKRTFPSSIPQAIWGQIKISAPIKGLKPSFAGFWRGFAQPFMDAGSIARGRESFAFSTENWKLLEEVEKNMLDHPTSPTWPAYRWQRFNNLVAASLGLKEKEDAQRYRILRDAEPDKPVEQASWIEKRLNGATSVPQSY